MAANRLMDALNNNGVKAKMLVRDKDTDCITVAGLGDGVLLRWKFLWDRWRIFCHLRFSRNHLFDIDAGYCGTDVTKTREFQEADVIHLHWVNQGMLSLKDIRKILESGKPVVWTMHDFWPATGICHYPRKCVAYKTGACHNCQYLPGGGSAKDLSTKIYKRKARIWSAHNVIFVTCSRWLGSVVRDSGLLTGKTVVSIPNPIDTHEYHPCPQEDARRRLSLPLGKRLILFASQRATDKRKGMEYMVEACRKLVEKEPGLKDTAAVVILGGHSDEFADCLPLPVFPIGYVSDSRKIVDVYNSADLFVLPSLEDNLPNTIMEAMACGVPCVGFDTGGIPEMIDHRRNGYVAAYKDAADLAEGMRWVLLEADRKKLSDDALHKVSISYSQQSVSVKYIETYTQALAYRRYRL